MGLAQVAKADHHHLTEHELTVVWSGTGNVDSVFDSRLVRPILRMRKRYNLQEGYNETRTRSVIQLCLIDRFQPESYWSDWWRGRRVFRMNSWLLFWSFQFSRCGSLRTGSSWNFLKINITDCSVRLIGDIINTNHSFAQSFSHLLIFSSLLLSTFLYQSQQCQDIKKNLAQISKIKYTATICWRMNSWESSSAILWSSSSCWFSFILSSSSNSLAVSYPNWHCSSSFDCLC